MADLNVEKLDTDITDPTCAYGPATFISRRLRSVKAPRWSAGRGELERIGPYPETKQDFRLGYDKVNLTVAQHVGRNSGRFHFL